MNINNDRLKNIELEILKEFIKVCESNNLQFYLLGGSCLGAVRHNGFIPWDDDIDVGMPRKDYNMFIEIAQSQLPSHLFLQNYNTDPDYYVCYSKIRDSRTTYIESSVRSRNINHGIYIDIFPLDSYPVKKRLVYRIKMFLLSARLSLIYESKCSFKMKVMQFISLFFYPSLSRAVIKKDSLMQSVVESELLANICGAWGSKEIVPFEWFGRGSSAVFEDENIIIPLEFDKYLTHLYGDYMTLPPVEKRSGHHSAEIIDFDKPYTFYTNKNL